MRTKISLLLFLGCTAIWLAIGCVKPYEPPEIVTASSLLVVDGVLLAGANARSTVKLSRTRRLSDTTTSAPETGARVVVEGTAQERFLLTEGPEGTYIATGLPLQPSGKYRLFIETTDGNKAASDYVQVKSTPPIDSLNWEEQNGTITILINTQDPQNNTRYYRWEYEETWEYRVPYDAIAAYENGILFFRDTNDQRFRCWRTENSSNILLGTSASLTQDVISRKPLLQLKAATEKFSVRYSILVRQYALTKEAFNYWQILQKNTEQRGSLFDAQPSQLVGNIRSISKPGEPVIGYLSASSVQEKRLFINFSEVADKYRSVPGCSVTIAPSDSVVFYLEALNKKPAYFITGGGVAISTDKCVDCTLHGGTNRKPSFW